MKSGEAEEPDQSVDRLTPSCALEEWTQNFGIQDVVRYLLLIWAGPAAAMFATGASVLVDDGALPGFHDSMVFSRAWFATLSVFTMLIGAMWLVRSATQLPSYEVLGSGWTGWKLHVAGLVGFFALSLVAPTAGAFERPFWLAAASAALLAGSGLSRWLLRVPVVSAQPLAAFLFFATFEMTVGWMWWDPVSDLGVAVLGATTLARGLALIGCVLGSAYALAVGHWPPVVSSAATFADRVRQAD